MSNTYIQCCYCKADNKHYPDITFNHAQSITGNKDRLSSFGCSNCKNFNEITNNKIHEKTI